ncbi:hypothetical protein [Magnetospirillum moscoviense]|nr:hypothetical protein [Magnetospirillum moscoviense]
MMDGRADRRRVMAWLTGGIAFARLGPAAAQSDLLDPAKLGKGGQAPKGAAPDDLLDGSRVRATLPSATAGDGEARPKRSSPGYARSMASSVVASMAGLASEAIRLIAEVKRLTQRKADLERQLADLMAERDIKLEEYRSGLFCSGCGLTRSEIHAKGETFPHPGQRIVQPTPEEIEAKERELQAPIDRLRRELDAVRSKLAQTIAERDEALDQLEHGLRLWRTAVTFEYELLALADHDDEVAHKARLEEIDSQLRKISSERVWNKDKRKDEELNRDWDSWKTMRAELDERRDRRRLANEKDRARATATANSERNELNGYIHSGEISHFIASRANASPIPDVGLGGLGGFYRMGDHNPKHEVAVLPNVRVFIDRFSASPHYLTSYAPPVGARAIP